MIGAQDGVFFLPELQWLHKKDMEILTRIMESQEIGITLYLTLLYCSGKGAKTCYA
jgi:hypothetical protein